VTDTAPERTVILHYHLFKNAGTSFDGILKRNFPGQWVTAEFAGNDNAAAVAAWIAGNPQGVVFSSHTATGPVPVVPGCRVITALFLRDPVARIRSAYLFERRQAQAPGDDRPAARLAASTDFEGYVRARLDTPGDRQCRDFHVQRLAAFARRRGVPELERATQALGLLSFVGEVERFGASMDRFAALVRPVWPGFDPRQEHLNRSEREEGVEIGPALAALLAEANAEDHALIDRARARLWTA
jgi:hypothetical protein